jgi:hypothetical protein
MQAKAVPAPINARAPGMVSYNGQRTGDVIKGRTNEHAHILSSCLDSDSDETDCRVRT